MKYFFAFLFSICLFWIGCNDAEESDPYNQALPAITNTGEHTFGFKLDGKSWVPGLDVNTQKPINAVMGNDSAFMLSINLINKKFNRNESIKIFFTCNKPSIVKPIQFTLVDANDQIGCQIYNLATNDLIFEVTYIDFTKQIISGTFQVENAKNDCGDKTIDISDGRFDCKFTK